MTWDFKRRLYCVERHASLATVGDLGDRRVHEQLQRYFETRSGVHAFGSDEKYSYYFEQVYPHERDRRAYIDTAVQAGVVSYGHLVLAALLATQNARVTWTTNFDTLVERAHAEVNGGKEELTVATLDSAAVATRVLNEGTAPLLVKLHGDYRYSQLKNTTEELRAQDRELRRALVDGCRRYGLTVVGYSGRDASVIDALTEAIDGGAEAERGRRPRGNPPRRLPRPDRRVAPRLCGCQCAARVGASRGCMPSHGTLPARSGCDLRVAGGHTDRGACVSPRMLGGVRAPGARANGCRDRIGDDSERRLRAALRNTPRMARRPARIS